MHRVWPPGEATAVDSHMLEELYRYPDDRTWLVVNFVTSADGAVEIEGHSAGLSNPTDRQVYWLGSDLADVVLLGARTAVIEEFRGIHPDERTADRRRRYGLSPIPPIAIVTSGQSLPPDAPVITEALTPTIVITHDSTPQDLRNAWESAGAEVLVAGDESVDLAAAITALAGRGLRRIDCEGGPRLLGSLLSAGLVDELRLTISPMLVSGAADRVAIGESIQPAALELVSVLGEADTLLLRYLVKR